jgi:hypothetical protein
MVDGFIEKVVLVDYTDSRLNESCN